MITRLSPIFFQSLLLALCLLGPPARAALPPAVAGDPLPSLAPMLEQVTPAVVNIATEGRVRQTLNPLFSDPFFQRFFDQQSCHRQRDPDHRDPQRRTPA